MYSDFWCELCITSHTKIRKVKSIVELNMNYSYELQSLCTTLLLIIFIPLKELIYRQGQMFNLKIANKSGNICEFCDRKWVNPDVCFDARIVNNGSSCMSPGFHIKFRKTQRLDK